MSLSPIEMVSLPPKSQEASLQKSIEYQRPTTEQRNINHKFNEQIMRHSEKTVATSKTENPEYRYDAKDRGSSPYYASQNKKKSKKEDKKQNKESKIGNDKGFDIKI